MSQPTVSIIVPTYRLGGIDCLKWTLDQQNYPHESIELVLVDGLYEKRREAVQAYFQGVDYRVVHVPPARLEGEPPIFPRDMCPRYRNTGIQRSTGDVLLFWSDFTLAIPTTVDQHVYRLCTVGLPVVVCGTHLYAVIPAGVIRSESVETDLDRYVHLVETLPKDSPIWISTFAREGPPAWVFVHALVAHQQDWKDLDPKLRLPSGVVIKPAFAHWKNESVLRQHVLAVAGFDEYYNDTHCADDLDFAYRLSNSGLRFILDKGIEVVIANPRPYSPPLRRIVSHQETLRDWNESWAKELDAKRTTLPRRSILRP